MAKGGIKAPVQLVFHSYYDPENNDPPTPLVLSGEDEDLKIGVHSGLKLDGIVTLEKLEMHDLLRKELDEGKIPLFQLIVKS